MYILTNLKSYDIPLCNLKRKEKTMINNKLTSTTLDQILEVIKKSKSYYVSGSTIDKSIKMGIKNVSELYDVAYQTIEDACRRRLGLGKINEFRRMLSEYFNGNPNDIKTILREHTDTDLHNKINAFFNGNDTSLKNTDEKTECLTSHRQVQENKTEIFAVRLDEETSKKIRIVSGFFGVSPSEWISENIKKKINEDLENAFKLLMEKK